MKDLCAVALGLLCCAAGQAQKRDAKLEAAMLPLLKDFKGEVGVFVKNLRTGKTAVYRPDSIFPTASIVKIPILVGVMNAVAQKKLSYHQTLTYKDSLADNSEGDILAAFKNNTPIELSKVLMLTLTTSDNTASLWLQSLAGTGTAINQEMEKLGLAHTRVNSRTPGREDARKQYGWGQTTPAEMASLLEKIVNRQLISDSASGAMLKLMSRNYWDEEGLSAIPPGVFVASKNGAVNASRSELMYVNAARTPYIFAIFTKNNTDRSWEQSNEAWVLTRRLSQLVWKYFND
ncbi:MAG: serine hydrolase [Bacteroidetes bacterium]|nr:MAG: serine hydrolase [Bacteroidota bacterium]